MVKSNRQEQIINLINNKVIITQEDLQTELENLGYNVTQSTVSRDIKELRIIKGHDANGIYRYIFSDTTKDETPNEHYRELFSKSAKSVDYSLNMVVIKCYNGMASSGCVAIDEMFGTMMLGTLAGDDTVIAVTKGEEQSMLLCDELKKLL